MRSIILTATVCVVSAMFAGCGGVEEKKMPNVSAEEKAKVDATTAAHSAAKPAAPAAK
jgi:hypothetical protein